MAWSVRQTPSFRELIKALLARGSLPSQYLPPEVSPGGLEWIEAFWELSTDRRVIVPLAGSSGVIVGVPLHLAIPSSSIRAWCLGWDPEEASLFRRAIRVMDKEFLEVVNSPEGEIPPMPSDTREVNDWRTARDAVREALRGKRNVNRS